MSKLRIVREADLPRRYRQRTSGDRWIAACFVLGVLLWAFALHGVYRLFH